MATILFSLFSLFVFSLLLLNTIFYPTLTLNYFNQSSLSILLTFSIIYLIGSIFKNNLLRPIIVEKNKKLIFPLLVISNILFIILEKTNYSNFVFSHFHLHLSGYLYLSIFSGLVYYVSFLKLSNLREKLFYFFFPIALIILGFFQVKHINFFEFLVKEDSILEILQFVLLIWASFYSIKIFFLLKKRKTKYSLKWLFLLLSITFLFIAGEEISWGQRIFNIKTPVSISKINAQNEINFHNLVYFQFNNTYFTYMFIGLYGIFSKVIVNKFFHQKNNNLKLLTPPNYLYPYFLIIFLVYFDVCFTNLYYVTSTYHRLTVLPWLEVGESFLIFGFFEYVYSTYKQIQKQAFYKKT